MSRFSRLSCWICFAAMALARFFPPPLAVAEVGDDGPAHGGPVYQRRAFEGKWRHDDRRQHHFHRSFTPPQVNAGWFQRPYPYHLDYYKMRYGGSYTPYFGNLYGPPQVVTAPPYYGPYYGNFDGAQPAGGMYPVEYPASNVYDAPPGNAGNLPTP